MACCNGSAYIHKHVVNAAFNILSDGRYAVRFIMPTHQPFVLNLHKTVHDFLAGGEDFLLLMDDDNPPKNNPMDLVELDLDVVGLPTPVWHCDTSKPQDRPYYLNALRAAVDHETGEKGFRPLDSYPGFTPSGLKACDAVGTGCVLIARRVLLTLMENCKGNPMEAPFMRRWNDRGEVVMGNDYAFCERARAAGFRIWAHFDYTCMHFNELELQEAIGAMMGFRVSSS